MWTTEKIAQLAANAAAEKRGRETARPNLWLQPSTDGQYLWGECKGSGTVPYKTQINLALPAFSCSCPLFAKPPCKHALGLLFMHAAQSDVFEQTQNYPEWVDKWRQKHQAAAAPKPEVAPLTEAESAKERETREKSKAQRREKRQQAMQAGLDILRLWLQDSAQQGAANANALQSSFWENIARQMTDAKMPRIGSYLKETAQLLQQQDEWLPTYVERLGELHFWTQLMDSRNSSSDDENNEETDNSADIVSEDDLMSAIGVNVMKKDVLAANLTHNALWSVVAIQEGSDIEGRDFRKVWLLEIPPAHNDSRPARQAFLLDFLFPQSGGYEQFFVWGSTIAAKAYFYPSATPQRALLPEFQLSNAPAIQQQQLQPYPTIEAMLQAFAEAYTQNPFLTEWLATLAPVRLMLSPNDSLRAFLRDTNGDTIAIDSADPNQAYRLLALSGGGDICLVGSLRHSQSISLFALLRAGAWVKV